MRDLEEEGPESLFSIAAQSGVLLAESLPGERLSQSSRLWIPGQPALVPWLVDDVISELVEVRALESLGSPIQTVSVRYSNPLDIALTATVVGVFFYGVLRVLRLARDWGEDKRIREAEASAAGAQARILNAKADLVEFAVREVKAGRQPTQALDLFQSLRNEDSQALDRMSARAISIESPPSPDQPSASDPGANA
ncbi:hypothetical protein [Actinoplanes sp. GCM10030250]|uniref:hypothetical protein n=1 Tax=Actinoplanes sp. GCM10030250 TaxID=3273376 RepID=UPI00361C3971